MATSHSTFRVELSLDYLYVPHQRFLITDVVQRRFTLFLSCDAAVILSSCFGGCPRGDSYSPFNRHSGVLVLPVSVIPPQLSFSCCSLLSDARQAALVAAAILLRAGCRGLCSCCRAAAVSVRVANPWFFLFCVRCGCRFPAADASLLVLFVSVSAGARPLLLVKCGRRAPAGAAAARAAAGLYTVKTSATLRLSLLPCSCCCRNQEKAPRGT